MLIQNEVRRRGGSLGISKREEKITRVLVVKNTFNEIVLEWYESKLKKWSAGNASDILEARNKDIFSFIGNIVISEMKPGGNRESQKSTPTFRGSFSLCHRYWAC
ncbi:hypothetical protein HMPREF0880_02202 [Yokenella regensburgei ATCC 43003]|jgi:hypothetical protein|nr:hypothetical protein HMPREF0880_02202 [Yokenella regensburgei ATCC 43003]